MDYAVAFLGNPGAEYQNTRHNIGFMVADRLVQRRELAWNTGDPLMHQVEYRYARRSVILFKPQTYMNLSGSAVKKVLNAHQLTPQQLIVVTDEYNFPVGRIHLRAGGSSGGHNGMASIIEEIGTPNFWRLRCGIDNAFGPNGLVDYVLSPFTAEQHQDLEAMIISGVEAIEEIIKHGPQRAMQAVNVR